MKYRVTFDETYSRIIDVEAEDEEDAEEQARLIMSDGGGEFTDVEVSFVSVENLS